MISVRSRAITLRSLNEDLISSSRLGWQSVAMGLPLFVILIALILLKLREFKYASEMKSNLRLFFILLLITAGTGVLWYLKAMLVIFLLKDKRIFQLQHF